MKIETHTQKIGSIKCMLSCAQPSMDAPDILTLVFRSMEQNAIIKATEEFLIL